MKRYTMMIALLVTAHLFAATKVRIVEVRGQIQMRRGLEETWEPAGNGMLLEDLDTILSGEASSVVLKLDDGVLFTLGGNAMLDIHDLRQITEKQLFLSLMSRKVSRIPQRVNTTPIRVTNVSTVRGSNEAVQPDEAIPSADETWIREKNGAQSLFKARYYTNTVAKLMDVLDVHPDCRDGGEMHWMLGRSFEALNQPGRAIEAYQTALSRYHEADDAAKDPQRLASITSGLQRLKSEQSN